MGGELPDPVPLGVSGIASVPRAEFVARGGRTDDLLLTDEERTAYVAQRLGEAFQRPLTIPGSEDAATAIVARFPDRDALLIAFAEKALETVGDGQMHSRVAMSPEQPSVAVSFVAWSGTHREVQPVRFGRYLESLAGLGFRLVEQGIQLYGLLEIDAYVRESADPGEPLVPLSEVFEVDVEFSFLPGMAFGYPADAPNPLPSVLMLNPDLLSPEETQLVQKLMH